MPMRDFQIKEIDVPGSLKNQVHIYEVIWNQDTDNNNMERSVQILKLIRDKK
jgi:hypothetical protein